MKQKGIISIYQFTNYKTFVKSYVNQLPKNGRGFYRKAADVLKTQPVTLSQVFKGDRNLPEEQGLLLCEYIGLNDRETDYFLLLIRLQKAGTEKLKTRYLQELAKLKEASQNLRNRLPQDLEMDEKAQAEFYSNWFFSATRLLTGIEGYQSTEKISEYLGLERSVVRKVLEFLVAHGLCAQDQKGRITMGPSRTHLEEGSILIARHHTNWRLKAIESLKRVWTDELHYTGPMVLSRETAIEIRSDLVNMIDGINKKVVPSKNEALSCLTVDWFKI